MALHVSGYETIPGPTEKINTLLSSVCRKWNSAMIQKELSQDPLTRRLRSEFT